MRDAFINTLFEEAKRDSNIVFLTGDLGFSVVERFAEELPNQFLNVGVAEQTMVGVAAGLASTGKRCFAYSIANFSTLRCLEQIRTDVCYHSLPVTMVSVGAGVAYGSLGYTHHAIEDIAAMRSLPGMTVGSPCDPLEAMELTKFFAHNTGPGYLRLGKNGETILNGNKNSITLLPHKLREGDDRVILCTGSVAALALQAAEELFASKGIQTEVWSFPIVKPLHQESLSVIAKKFSKILTLEEHVHAGGFGSSVLEAMSKMRLPVNQVYNIALNEGPMDAVGNVDYIRGQRGLSLEVILDELKL